MSALLIDDGEPFELVRADLSAGMTEKWLQRVLFENPRLLPIDQMALGAGKMVPVCREDAAYRRFVRKKQSWNGCAPPATS